MVVLGAFVGGDWVDMEDCAAGSKHDEVANFSSNLEWSRVAGKKYRRHTELQGNRDMKMQFVLRLVGQETTR